MKLTKTKANWLLLITVLQITSSEASSYPEVLRVLSVGTGGSSSSSAADLLSGGKASAQQHREMEKTPVMADESRPMMLVTGPNLCEEDADPQSFRSALLLSSPGPHAVLMLLHPEDPPAGQCDSVRQAQELLGAEVLQFCIVLLLQNQQEPFTGASRGIAGEMIRACGGRFHIISDSQPKPAQTAALVAEIEKLVWLNGGRFYELIQTKQLEIKKLALLKNIQEIEKRLEKNDNQVVHEEYLFVIYDSLGRAAGIVGWIFLILFNALLVYTKENDNNYILGATFTVHALIMIYLRQFLSPDVAIPLNLALITSLTTEFTTVIKQDSEIKEESVNTEKPTVEEKSEVWEKIYFSCVELWSVIMICFSLVFGSMISVRTWSDVLIALYMAPGVTLGIFVFRSFCSERIARNTPVFVLGSFLFCSVGELISVGCVWVFAWMFSLPGVTLSIILLILGQYIIIIYIHFKRQAEEIWSSAIFILFLSCICVLIGSIVLNLGMIMNLAYLIMRSPLHYVILFLGSLILLWRWFSKNR